LKIQIKIVFSILKIKYYFENTIVPNTADVIPKRRLGWFGDVKRKDERDRYQLAEI